MKVLVTGASGYVGSAVTRELVNQGHEVTGMVRSPAKAAAVENMGAKSLVGNLFDPESWTEAVREMEVVVSATRPVKHGSRLSVEESHRRSYNHGRMVGNLLTSAQGSRVKCVLLTYGVQGFGEHGAEWLDERAALSPAGYEHTVTGAFWHIDKTSRKTRVPIINIFTGWPYGKGGWLEDMAADAQKGTLRVVAGGGNYLSLIHIDDLSTAYARIVEKLPVGNRFCIVDGNPVTQAELARLVAGSVGAPPPKNTDTQSFTARAGELLAQAWTTSTRVAADRIKTSLLPGLKIPSVSEGGPAAIEEAGLSASAAKEMARASGF